VVPTTDASTSEAYPGIEPSAKHNDPTMNSTPVHHGARVGRHPTRVSARQAARGSTTLAKHEQQVNHYPEPRRLFRVHRPSHLLN
jgi:hypothetical protein